MKYSPVRPWNRYYDRFEYDKLVRPVDVEITVTGYTKKG